LATALDRGRDAAGRQAWASAYDELTKADREKPLELDDLERLATAAHLLGRDDDGGAILGRAHREALRRGDEVRAARHAFWLALNLLDRGDAAQVGGWLARASRLLEGHPDCVEQGYLTFAAGLQTLDRDPVEAAALFEAAGKVAHRYRDADLATLSLLGRGDALIALGRTDDGMLLLDEAMVAVTAGDVAPMVVGIVYCAVIDVCQRTFDLRRAQEWTAALTRWIETQPEMVRYRGQCLLYRAELMRLHGAWQDAMDEASRAQDRLRQPPSAPELGEAVYQLAELHRLRGAFAEADDAYREASLLGRRPEPGLALLRQAQGQSPAAVSAIGRALDDAPDPAHRPRLLEAAVEIRLAAGNIESAAAAAGELSELAVRSRAPLLRAMADRARGSVELARRDGRAALRSLRRAWTAWRDLDAPYEAARTRVLIGQACRSLGDADAAALEFEAARHAFAHLGAAPDVDRIDSLAASPDGPPSPVGPLTAREIEVLRLVAAGKSNRAIAADLAISEKTVARHLSNIFTKLDLSSRSAATAYAYEHRLVVVST
jgi:DNA-binding CsgD family transcriptional regulator/tetratricopeptide (TPR) repeat protein